MPAGALLAGREVARLTRAVDPGKLNRVLAAVVVLAVVGFGIHYFGPRARNPLIQQTIATKRLAREIERQGGREFPLVHTDDPTGLQIFLNTYRRPVSFNAAAAMLGGQRPAFVATCDLARLRAALQPGGPPVYSVLEGSGPVAKMRVTIVGNRPLLSPLPE